MAKSLDNQTKQAVSERLRFYRELGIYDLYRRPVEESVALEETTPPYRVETTDAMRVGHNEEPTILQDRPAALRGIREDLGDCTRCKLHEQGRKQIVFGVGNPQAELMFVGEGPGADEDQQGEPFVGRAGQLLNNMIAAMGLKREDVYIANVVKCRPPGNRTPERDECDTCGPFLMRQIAVIRPKVIVALGAVAAKYLLGVNDSMINLRGRFYEFMPHLPKDAPERDPSWEGAKLAVTYHPAYLLRDPRQKKEAWKDLQMVMAEMGLTVPGKSEE
jgi:DNA polymerase